MGLFGAGDPPCPAGSICSGQARTFVGKKTKTIKQNVRGGGTVTKQVASEPGTGIYHSSATKLHSDGSSTTDVYIIKDNKWQKAATTTNGGKTYTFDDDVAGSALQNELSDPEGGIHKNIDAGVNIAADKASVPPTTKANLLDSNKNKAENDNDADDSSKPIASASSTQNNTGTRKNFGTLMFPNDLGSSTMDVIKFDMLEFKPRKRTISGALGGFGPRDTLKKENRNSIGSVTLPIPAGIQDQNQAGWGDGRLNPIQVAGVGIAMDAFNKSLSDAANTVAGKLGNVSNNSGELKNAVKGYFTAAAVGVPIDQILARTQGQVLNPNLELLFNGPILRPFNFTFKMSARNKEESASIVQIIRFFKQGMSPQRTDSNLFVKAPHTFQLQYRHRNLEQHKFLNQFKECALIGLSVNYTPENNYATFEDGAMVSYEMQMQFKELDPVYNEDYGNAANEIDTKIGF